MFHSLFPKWPWEKPSSSLPTTDSAVRSCGRSLHRKKTPGHGTHPKALTLEPIPLGCQMSHPPEPLREEPRCSPRDQTAHHMQHRDVVLSLFLPAYEDSTKPIHPAVGALHDPAARLEPSALLDQLGFLSSGADVSREMKLLQKVTDLVVVVPLVHADVLRLLRRGLGLPDRNAVDRFFDHFEVVAVGSVDSQSNRYTRSFSEQTALDAVFGAIRRIRAGFFPRREVPCSSRHPSTAKPSRCLRVCRSSAGLASRSSRRLPLRTTSETSGGPKNSCRCPSHSVRSTDIRSATRRGWRSWRHGQIPVVDDTRAGGAWEVEATVPSSPTVRPECASRRPWLR